MCRQTPIGTFRRTEWNSCRQKKKSLLICSTNLHAMILLLSNGKRNKYDDSSSFGRILNGMHSSAATGLKMSFNQNRSIQFICIVCIFATCTQSSSENRRKKQANERTKKSKQINQIISFDFHLKWNALCYIGVRFALQTNTI